MQNSLGNFGISFFFGIGFSVIGLISILRGKISVGLGRSSEIHLEISGIPAYILGVSNLLASTVILYVPLHIIITRQTRLQNLLDISTFSGIFIAILGISFSLIIHIAIDMGARLRGTRKKKRYKMVEEPSTNEASFNSVEDITNLEA